MGIPGFMLDDDAPFLHIFSIHPHDYERARWKKSSFEQHHKLARGGKNVKAVRWELSI